MAMDAGEAAIGSCRQKQRPLLILGFDAMDHPTAEAFAAAGHMPVLRRLLATAARCPLRLPPGVFVNALWPSFSTGLRADRHGFLCWDMVEPATYRRRMTTPQTIPGNPFWRRLAAAGHATAAIDVPHTVIRDCAAQATALEIAEWGSHDRHLGLQVWPPAEAGKLARFAPHPIFSMAADDPHDFSPDDYMHRAGAHRTREETKTLVDGLVAGIENKRKLVEHYRRARPWELFIGVFGEPHGAGHQFWHLHDTSHPRYDQAVVDFIGGDPIRQIYAAEDAALGKLLDGIEPSTNVLVMLSHGMGPHHDGTHLLEEVLRRIDLAERRATGEDGWRDAARRRLRQLGETALRALLSLRRPVARRELALAVERAEQRFFLAPNNNVFAGVRLNLAGREPRGRVRPEETDAVLDSLERDLKALINTKTGTAVFNGAERADRFYRRSKTDALPDLFLDWERSAPIESVWSAKTGLVAAPYTHWRTGDHRPHGLMLALGPDMPMGRRLPPLAIEDLPASLMRRFGEEADDMDGRPVGWLAEPRVSA